MASGSGGYGYCTCSRCGSRARVARRSAAVRTAAERRATLAESEVASRSPRRSRYTIRFLARRRAVSFRGFSWFLLALVPLYLALAALVPPFDDELYYWCWSRDLQLSYYDHPPM